ncbi:hypothetical protein JOD96_001333 [Flavobacterium sp. 1355]|nr:hypothetical protein [Flavobacterium sp. 1355]
MLVVLKTIYPIDSVEFYIFGKKILITSLM